MNIIIYLIGLLILVSKFFDCRTTSRQITSVSQEKNPIARKIMAKIGTHTTIWAIFVISILVVISSIWILFNFYDNLFYKLTFVILGLIITITQFAVSHTNHTKRLNYFTKLLTKIYSR